MTTSAAARKPDAPSPFSLRRLPSRNDDGRWDTRAQQLLRVAMRREGVAVVARAGGVSKKALYGLAAGRTRYPQAPTIRAWEVVFTIPFAAWFEPPSDLPLGNSARGKLTE
jgi:hypothetical protein